MNYVSSCYMRAIVRLDDYNELLLGWLADGCWLMTASCFDFNVVLNVLIKELRSAAGCLVVATPRGPGPVAVGCWLARTASRAAGCSCPAHPRCFDVAVGRCLCLKLARLEPPAGKGASLCKLLFICCYTARPGSCLLQRFKHPTREACDRQRQKLIGQRMVGLAKTEAQHAGCWPLLVLNSMLIECVE